ncbi:FKBP-type peptidyl-prolyl cis-trans isomerase [Olivibacter sp. SDN3]|uniref:FKBP-type peptidyl-prolyl cis-trans isomerase n=1 Tax=Olivibacter sp. SDN3 TaxID=2764720 RepID=UPI001650DCC5|nr:FKBP-type peptidyl-prolyl cis-trans isomerase [Olivibacter sp. SDN3]QNL51467.1 FKBP-type peptidyl-prolyl cis-trans isomerase [Olivibacter sp. SDN3]
MISPLKKLAVGCLLVLTVFAACNKQEYQSVEALDAQNIEAYIQANNLNVQPLGNTGMYYQVVEEGKGAELDYTGRYPIVYTVKSLDGSYNVADTFSASNRYMDYLGYFLGSSPQGSSAAASPNYQEIFERDEGLKHILRNVLQKADGKVRVLIPSRLLNYGPNGNDDLGIPPNASMDYVLHVIDSASMPAYEDASIRKRIEALGLNLEEYETTESGIYYHISEQGTGDPITVDSTVTVAYALTLFNGNDIERSDSASFALTGLIPAWREVVPKLNKGGEVRFFSPSKSAYGYAGGNIPFSPLEFSITVRDDSSSDEDE